MDFTKVPKYTARQIETLARQFLREKCKPVISIPIDVDFLMEQESGVVLDCLPHIIERYNVAGVIMREGKHFKVYIDEEVMNENPNFYRFTVVEELGHLRLHRPILEQITSFDEAVKLHEWEGYWEIDRNAKRFAAAVLMPSPYIVEDARTLYKELINRVGFRDPSVILKYLVDQLSKRYGVSPKAMGIRLGEWPVKVIEKVELALKEELDYLP